MRAGWRDGARARGREEFHRHCEAAQRPRQSPSRARTGLGLLGVTLVELLVVLVLFGIIAGTTSAALRHQPRRSDDAAQAQAQLRRQAIRSGEPATMHDSLGHPIRFLPDGRAVGPGVDPLTGRVRGTR